MNINYMNRSIAALVFAALIASCGSKSEDKQSRLEELKKQQAQFADEIKKLEADLLTDPAVNTTGIVRTVVAEPLSYRSFTSYIDIQGKIDADENVAVSAQTPGTISHLFVRTGESVRRGQLLAELDNQVIKQGISELQSSLDFTTNLYLRQKNLWDQKIGTEVQFLTAKNQKESLEKKMATLKEQLEMTRIKSPINGTVDAVDIKIGQSVVPGMPAIRVVNANNLKVKGDLAERYTDKVDETNNVVIIIPDAHDTITTRLSYAARVINPISRSFSVEAKLYGSNDYRPNMVAILKIVEYSNNKAIVIPVSTIQHAEEGDFVLIAEKNKAKKAAVVIGKIYNGNAEVLSGIKPGDRVITLGYQDLNEGENLKY